MDRPFSRLTTAMDLTFSNRFTNELPGDPSSQNRPRQVHNAFFSAVDPAPTSDPSILAVTLDVIADLGLDQVDAKSETFIDAMTGNVKLEGMEPYAMCYGGHQFGNWAGQLGDGRAIALGEVATPNGDHLTLQLKGSGPTPYSRGADGFAVLRSSVREFLCSEAMHHLGVPTTRALSLALTGDDVVRDMLYDGHPAPEPGAIVCRVAPSFVRFGSFELPSSRGEIDQLRQLVDFTVRHDFPHLGDPSPDTYVAWYREVAERTADLIVHWMRVGFVHGVMNTDNLSILGLTIDYGPYGWLEDYDPTWTPNTTDAARRRYRFGAQAEIAQWNVAQLGNALYPLIEDAEPLQSVVSDFADYYKLAYRKMMADKLGLVYRAASPGHSEPVTTQTEDSDAAEDILGELIFGAHETLSLVETDMTIFYRRLADIPTAAVTESDVDLAGRLNDAYYVLDQVTPAVVAATAAWLREVLADATSSGVSDADRKRSMNETNPKYVLRNYLAQLAIDDAQTGDNGRIHELQRVLRNPYDEQPESEHLAQKRPDWARTRVGCSQLSCSS